MDAKLLLMRYLGGIAVIGSLFGAALMLFIGIMKTVKAYVLYLNNFSISQEKFDSGVVNQTIAFLIQSIDAFMIGLVFMLFSYGVFTLFIRRIDLPEGSVFDWVQIFSMNRLKSIIGELIVIILSVKFLEIILLSTQQLSFEMIVLPVGILLLSLALKFLDLKN